MDNLGLDVPEWLLIEVLLRLPVAVLYRFKVVCKEWLSLISSPYFIGKYATREPKSPRWAFVSAMGYDCSKHDHGVEEHELLMDLHSGDLKCAVPNINANEDLRMTKYVIMGVSNGLVLCRCYTMRCETDEYRSYWGVCNPVTKQCFVLSPRHDGGFYLADSWGFLTQMKDGVVTSYTVVAYLITESRFEVFFSETGKWEAYNVPSSVHIDHKYMHLASTELDGILYWINPLKGIIAYDPHRNPNEIKIVDFPSDRDDRMPDKGRLGMCGTHQGRLRYFESAALSLSVWVLEDYGRGDNWLLQHRANYTDIMRDVLHDKKRLRDKIKLQPISFHPFDPDVIFLGCDYVFVSYNMRERRTQVLKTYMPKKERRRGYPWRRALSLVIPQFPLSLPLSDESVLDLDGLSLSHIVIG